MNTYLLIKDTLDFSTQNNILERQWIIKELAQAFRNKKRGIQIKIVPLITDNSDKPDYKKSPKDIKYQDLISIDSKLTPVRAKKILEDVKEIETSFEKHLKHINAVKIENKNINDIIKEIVEALEAKSLINNKEDLDKTKKESNQSPKIRNWTIFFAAIVCFLFFLQDSKKSKRIEEVERKASDTIESVRDEALKSVKLVFAGGGSVANMINTKYGVDCKTYKNSLRLDLPSQHAWPLMAEEVMNNHSDSSKNTNRFYPICLSALEANESDFTKIVDSDTFKAKGTVVSYHIGDDPLIVYTNLFEFDSVDTVSNKDLSSAIMKRITWDKDKHKYEITDTFRLYITQEGSGTYYCYSKHFNINKYKNLLTWYDDSLTSNQLPSPNESIKYVILTSEYYTPKDIASCRGEDKKIIVDNNKQPIKKPLFIYFVAHRNDNYSKTITIPEEMVDFMNNTIGKKDTTKIIRKKIHQNYSKIITPFEDLIDWIQSDSSSNNVIN